MPDLQVVIIVEKETVFMRLIQSHWFNLNYEANKKVLIVTGKGYPDFDTRRFICLLSMRQSVKLYYLGDADPYGNEIFLTYMFGSVRSALCDNKAEVTPIHKLQFLGPFLDDF